MLCLAYQLNVRQLQCLVEFVKMWLPGEVCSLRLPCSCSCVGQHFIFVTISMFGPLTCSIITTTRKFFTILSSVILFQHSITVLQWEGTTLVFAGLILDIVFGKEQRIIPVVHRAAAITNCL